MLLDAWLLCGPRQQLVPEHALEEYLAAGRYYSWGGSAEREALLSSIKYVEAALRTHAPIHALGGFSQGALVAAAVAASEKGISHCASTEILLYHAVCDMLTSMR